MPFYVLLFLKGGSNASSNLAPDDTYTNACEFSYFSLDGQFMQLSESPLPPGLSLSVGIAEILSLLGRKIFEHSLSVFNYEHC